MSASQRQSFKQLGDAMNRAVIGQEHVVKTLILALLTNGNVLLEGLPGTAKTRSVKTLAKVLDASLGRISRTLIERSTVPPRKESAPGRKPVQSCQPGSHLA